MMQRGEPHSVQSNEAGRAGRHPQRHPAFADRHAGPANPQESAHGQGEHYRQHEVERIEQTQARPRAAVLRQRSTSA